MFLSVFSATLVGWFGFGVLGVVCLVVCVGFSFIYLSGRLPLGLSVGCAVSRYTFESLLWFKTAGGSIVVSCDIDRWDGSGKICNRLPTLCVIFSLT